MCQKTRTDGYAKVWQDGLDSSPMWVLISPTGTQVGCNDCYSSARVYNGATLILFQDGIDTTPSLTITSEWAVSSGNTYMNDQASTYRLIQGKYSYSPKCDTLTPLLDEIKCYKNF